jgi:hypothetical protein
MRTDWDIEALSKIQEVPWMAGGIKERGLQVV